MLKALVTSYGSLSDQTRSSVDAVVTRARNSYLEHLEKLRQQDVLLNVTSVARPLACLLLCPIASRYYLDSAVPDFCLTLSKSYAANGQDDAMGTCPATDVPVLALANQVGMHIGHKPWLDGGDDGSMLLDLMT